MIVFELSHRFSLTQVLSAKQQQGKTRLEQDLSPEEGRKEEGDKTKEERHSSILDYYLGQNI